MLSFETATKLFESVNGSTFIGLDTETKVHLKGGKKNPHKDRITKRTTSNVMVFQNKKSNAYKNMVERRLIAEGKDPSSFELQPRRWGKRIPNTPFIKHNGEYYLEVIFLNSTKSEYFLDGNPIHKKDIIDLPTHKEGKQGDLDDKVIIRTYKLSSIKALRMNNNSYIF